eukprot:CAMPEP_0183327544 /NCGR_PEP_ID=MMETSP0160_2-20130417/83815_1 /TAXON_ID=2839 ORGANISM="Odontella Sinensis, Strain Grunow 1884" /NCGR_SAMPLE_ID=MMETSP0160_2 /ASSEMBLY_ACC=CAM_ASM_000250 /LENGTH=102 /DNA_ID=CAMNT_0025495677 /DNA_START=1405 /DNA_END=1710 /DNA_ORIENTATION=-
MDMDAPPMPSQDAPQAPPIVVSKLPAPMATPHASATLESDRGLSDWREGRAARRGDDDAIGRRRSEGSWVLGWVGGRGSRGSAAAPAARSHGANNLLGVGPK